MRDNTHPSLFLLFVSLQSSSLSLINIVISSELPLLSEVYRCEFNLIDCIHSNTEIAHSYL